MQFKKQKIILIILGIWIALVIFFGLSLKIASNSNIIEKVLFEKYGLSYEAVNLKTDINFKLNLKLTAKNIKIFNKDKTKCFVDVNNPDISIKLISLIFKKIYIKKFNSDNILINIKRNKDGLIDIAEILKTDDFDNVDILRLNSKIDKLDFTFEDDYIVKSKTRVLLNNSNINIFNKKKQFLINTKGIIETSINNKESQIANIDIKTAKKQKSDNFNFDINIDNLNLYLLTDFANEYISKDIKTFKGIANLSLKTNEKNEFNLVIKKPSLVLKDNREISPYNEVNINSKFMIQNNDIEIDSLTVLSNNLNIKTAGKIEKFLSKEPKVELTNEINDTQINNFLYFIPDNAIFYRPKGIPSLKQSNFHGVLSGKTQLKLFPLEITGSLKAENIHIPGYPKPYKQNDATLIFMKDKMRVYTRVYTPDNEYVAVDGVSNLDDSLYGKYDIKSTKKIDLSFAQKYLVPIQQIIGFNIGPVPIMDISGYGNIDIKTQGTINDAQIFGQFSAYNASAYIHGLDAKLVNGDCKLIFDNKNLIFKKIHGSLDNADFLLTGTGNTKGEVELSVNIQKAYLNKILNTFKNSVITKDYSSITKNISAVSGLINTNINLRGTIKDYEKEEFLNDLDLDGNIEFKNNKVVLNNSLGIKNATGILNFGNKTGQNGHFEFFINNSKFNTAIDTKATLTKISSGEDFDVNVILNSEKCALSDIIHELKKTKITDEKVNSLINNIINDIDFYSKISLNINSKISLNSLNFAKTKIKGYIVGLNSSKNKNVLFKQGLIRIVDNNIIFDNFKALLFSGFINAKGSIDSGLRVSLNDINLDKFDGLINKIKFKNAIIKSGEIFIKKDNLKLSAINIDYNKMPLLINLSSKISSNNENFEADFSTILNETTTDYLINPYLSYPIKVKGEIPLRGKFAGNLQDYLIDFTAKIPKESDISYSGANIGDINQDREISGRLNVNRNVLSLNNLKLVKYIKNQNNKINQMPVVNLNGKIYQKENGAFYDNLKLVTSSPVNVRMINLIFKKSILKKGNFECNVNLNGNILSPQIIGKIDLQDLDIPLYDTQINNIKINITPKYIDADIQAKNKQSDLQSVIQMENKLQPPFIVNKIAIDSSQLNIQDILQSVPVKTDKQDISKKQDFIIKPQDIIVKEGKFDFENVVFDKISAKNLKGNFSYKNELFDLKNIMFNIANGEVNAKGDYSLKSTKLSLKADIKDCDSNILAKDFLNIRDQIFGKMTGAIDLTAKNLNTPEGIKNIESSVTFSIDNGKMPKLGSLEYLLRAGNLLKNGILGLSLNNIIQVLTPYKTGEFEKISGKFDIKHANVKNLEILSKGKNLSMYLFGNYSILENMADIKIYGRLSQNVSSALGSFGNASIKQFLSAFSTKSDSDRNSQLQEYLDKIPLVDNSDQGGYFSARVSGDINKDNYIKKFNWE